MTSNRRRATANLATLALQAPFVATHRLATELSSPNAMSVAFAWQRLAWEKYFASLQAASAMMTSAMRHPMSFDAAGLTRLTDAALAPVAKRVRRNVASIRRSRR